MSEVKVNKISPRSGTDVTLGDSGDTFTVPTGVTLDTSNSTVTLPDGTVTNAKVNASAAIDYSKLNLTGNIALTDLSATGTKDATTFLRGDNTFGVPPLGGITEADQWRLTANLTTTGLDITSNLERNDTSFAYIGTGMTESSGVFTFPSTGIYFIDFNTVAYGSGVGDVRYAGGNIKITTNNSSYSDIAESYNGCNSHGSPYYFSTNSKIFFDVTDTSTHKVKFFVSASASVVFNGNTDSNRTCMTFIRLGDT